MKTIPLVCALALGVAIGWMVRGASAPAREVERRGEVRLPERKRPTVATHAPEARVPSFTEAAGVDRARKFERWVDGMTAANWRGYLDAALSPEARDHGFLHHVSLESMMLLQRMGEMGGGDAVRALMDARFAASAAEAMEGWANKDPEAAMQWVEKNRSSWDVGENGEVRAKAAGAMIGSDPDRVWKVIGMTEPVARELIRRKGLAEMDELLVRYWTRPPAEDPRQDQILANQFGDWQVESARYRNQDLKPDRDYKEKDDRRRAIYEDLLGRNPNPKVKDWLELQLGNMPPR